MPRLDMSQAIMVWKLKRQAHDISRSIVALWVRADGVRHLPPSSLGRNKGKSTTHSKFSCRGSLTGTPVVHTKDRKTDHEFLRKNLSVGMNAWQGQTKGERQRQADREWVKDRHRQRKGGRQTDRQ